MPRVCTTPNLMDGCQVGFQHTCTLTLMRMQRPAYMHTALHIARTIFHIADNRYIH